MNVRPDRPRRPRLDRGDRSSPRSARCGVVSHGHAHRGRVAARRLRRRARRPADRLRAVERVDGDAELVVLVTTYRGAGAGTALLDAVVDRAQARAGWKRLWLVTSNDNTDAIRMYQRAGWDWVDFRRDAITRRAATQARDPRDRQPRHPDPPRDRVRSTAVATARGILVAEWAWRCSFCSSASIFGGIYFFQYRAPRGAAPAWSRCSRRGSASSFSRDDTHAHRATCRSGSSNRARAARRELVIVGTHNDLPLSMFDYEYYVQGDRSREYHRFTCAVLTIPGRVPAAAHLARDHADAARRPPRRPRRRSSSTTTSTVASA